MVTSTRRGPVDSTPRSTPRRSKRNATDNTPADMDTPTMPKKRRTVKKSALSTAEASAPTTETETEDTSATATQEESTLNEEQPTPRRVGSPKVVVPVSSPVKEVSLESEIQDSIVHTPSPPREAGYVMSSIARHQHASPTPAKPKPTAGKKGRKTRLSGVEEDASDTVEETKKSGAPKPVATRIRFGSEEPMDVDTPTVIAPVAPPKPAAPKHDDDESDSDDAPEEVATSAAFTKAKAAEAEATRAFQAQQKKLEAKRKERLQRVADEQRVKRDKEDKKAAKLAKQEARQAAAEPVKAPFKFDMNSLPSLLPASILEAAGDKRPPTPPPMISGPSEAEKRKEQLARHIRFLERGEKPVKDVKKGKLNVHVLEKDLKTLAPKVNTDTKNVRERWLKGRQNDRKFTKGKLVMKRGKVERRNVGGGFLRGED